MNSRILTNLLYVASSHLIIVSIIRSEKKRLVKVYGDGQFVVGTARGYVDGKY